MTTVDLLSFVVLILLATKSGVTINWSNVYVCQKPSSVLVRTQYVIHYMTILCHWNIDALFYPVCNLIVSRDLFPI